MTSTPDATNAEADATSAALQDIFGAPPPKATPQVEPPAPPPAPEAPSIADPSLIGQIEQQAASLGRKPKVELKARTEAGVNYAAAFLLFSKGVSLKEIADEFGLSFATLTNKARSEDWDQLVVKHGTIVAPPPRPSATPVSAELVVQKARAIEENRAENLAVAQRLRANVVRVLSAYEQDNKFLRPEDILTLAKASKMLAETSMLSLGDDFVTKSPATTGGAGGSGMQPIIINLPSAVSSRRELAAEPTEIEASPTEIPEVQPLQEVTIVGRRAGEREAVASKSKVGHSINFEALSNPPPDA